MKNIFSEFTNCYSVQKTLRFSLIPQGSTIDNIKKYGIIEEDSMKAEVYKEVKRIFDKCHKQYIDMVLSNTSFDWKPLADAYSAYQKDKNQENEKVFDIAKQDMRNIISKLLTKNINYKSLEPKQIIDNAKNKQNGKAYDATFVDFLTEHELNNVAFFDRFATYFSGYKENRENIYAKDGSTAIAYRLVDENFPKFMNNIRLFDSLSEEMKAKIQISISFASREDNLSDIFSVNYFNQVLQQSGIDRYNLIIGGKTEDGNIKIQGINEICNQAYQQNVIDKRIKFVPLFKQILSEGETASFLFDVFGNDSDVLEGIKSYTEKLFSDDMMYSIDVFKKELTNGLYDSEHIYIEKKQLAVLSNLICGEWDVLHMGLSEQKIKEQKVYTLGQLQNVTEINIINSFTTAFKEAETAVFEIKEKVAVQFASQEIKSYEDIKAYLDSVVKLEQLLKIFAISDDYDKDSAFYGEFDVIYAVLRDNIPLYNKVRNYATKKPYSTEKSKLNFYNPILADGWDQNKEKANNAIILIRDGHYYLGIYNAKNKKVLAETDTQTDFCYKKMVYKLLPGPNKMLPKVFFSKAGIENFGVDEKILAGYNEGRHKKGDSFDIGFCHCLIDYFKQKIAIHPDWSKFGFEFSDTSSYKDISEFYNEISKQAYKMTYSYVSDEEINSAMDNGTLFLFEIYNKDFSDNSTGKKNLHTLYWEQIFAEENLKNVVYKLNGGAELFYRPASVKNVFTHKKGEILINKVDSNHISLDDEAYKEIVEKIKNGVSIEQLRKQYRSVTFRYAPHDIVKDKRYCKDSFSFHVPITINCNADANSNLNKKVLEVISDNQDLKIIGIDRGERNLIYVSLIDQCGNIIEQKHFNIVGGTDYLQKLKILAKDRDDARKNWKNIGKIKDLKEGYLSLVIHEITDMMIEHNAIIAMEDLNFGFKRGRFHFEQQVYQKFEKMLIDKLNYLANKEKAPYEEGGISCAYQLTSKFESFRKLGKQSGFLFYIPARYTSKIDPKTGFVNLFTSDHFKSRDFFEKFNSVSYNNEEDTFEFEFDYRNFNIDKDYTNRWTVSTYGDERIAYSKKDGRQVLNVSQRMKALFEENGIEYNNKNLKEKILAVGSTSFRNTLSWLFKLTVTLRHENSSQDYILSPVKNSEGKYFDSRKALPGEPIDGDANGAYHIALQGLRLLKNRIGDGKILSDGDGKQTYNWLEFAQKKEYQK